MYDQSASSVTVASTAPRVAVVLFEDQRDRFDLGVRKDGSAFQPGSGIVEWVSQSLADELTRKGVQVSIASSFQQAQASHPDHIITGVVERVWLEEKNLSTYDATIRIQVRIQSESKPLITKNFAAQQEKTGVPGAKLAEDTLSGTLKDVLSGASVAISELLRQ
jgi:hypothetical protein